MNRIVWTAAVLLLAWCGPLAMGQEYYHGLAYYGSGYRDYNRANPSYFYGSNYSGPAYFGSNAAPIYVSPSTTGSAALLTPPSSAAPALPANEAYVRMIVPDAKARMSVNGQATKATGTDRLFVTTPPAGSKEPYKVRASWKENGQDVTVEWPLQVIAGRTTVIGLWTSSWPVQ